MECSPALVLLLYQQSNRDMAAQALLHMQGTYGATALGWAKEGAKIFNETQKRLCKMLAFPRRSQDGRRDEAVNEQAENLRKFTARLMAMGATKN